MFIKILALQMIFTKKIHGVVSPPQFFYQLPPPPFFVLKSSEEEGELA